MNAAVRPPELLMPWESDTDEDSRFRKILRNVLAAFTAFAILIPLLPVSEINREQQEEVPPHLARVILEKQALPEPVPVIPKPKPKPKPKPIERKPVAKPKPVKPVAVKKPELSEQVKLEQAKDKAAVAGVLAFQDDLTEMRDSLDLDSMPQAVTSRGEANAAKTERAIIASSTVINSGGINTASLSRDTGGPALSGRETTRVESGIATTTNKKAGKSQSAQLGGRSDDSIRQVMDRNKGSIFAIYNRALRKDSLLEGKLVFEMLISASGEVAEITLLSSELDDEELTRKILSRIRMIRFEVEDVVTTRVNYSFDFLPYS